MRPVGWMPFRPGRAGSEKRGQLIRFSPRRQSRYRPDALLVGMIVTSGPESKRIAFVLPSDLPPF